MHGVRHPGVFGVGDRGMAVDPWSGQIGVSVNRQAAETVIRLVGLVLVVTLICALAGRETLAESRLERALEKAWARDKSSWETALERDARRQRLLGSGAGSASSSANQGRIQAHEPRGSENSGAGEGSDALSDALSGAGRAPQAAAASGRRAPRTTAPKAEGAACSDRVDGRACPNLQSLVAQAAPGELLELPPGDYVQCFVQPKGKPLRLDFQGGRLHGKACAGKAAIVQNAPLQLRNLECFDIAVPDGNGACVRQQAGGLALHNVVFRDSQSGVLSSPEAGVLRIRGGRFENLGGDCRLKCGRAHGIYYQGPELHIDGAVFRTPRDEAHLIKTGAARTVIADSVFDETEGFGSRVVDAYNGGVVELRDSRIVAASGDGNHEVIGFGHERRRAHEKDAITIVGSRIDCAFGPLVGGREDLVAVPMRLEANELVQCRLPATVSQ